ncbi:MAG: V-type ATP synthase subunit F [Hadesarchaea archaeon]|nr:V-type ATP synthase subunit F [Hadesarchaea archaeon]
MKIASITDPDTSIGLKLAGVEETHQTTDPDEAEELLEELLVKEDIGVIILSERLAQEMSQYLLEIEENQESVTPIIVEIPDKEGPIPERAEKIQKIVRRAVGIELKK